MRYASRSCLLAQASLGAYPQTEPPFLKRDKAIGRIDGRACLPMRIKRGRPRTEICSFEHNQSLINPLSCWVATD